jgi:hypothetical protein
MKRIAFLASVLLLFVVAVAAFTDGFKRIKQKLTGYEEVPSVSTGASGEFKGRISNAEDQVEWSLSYSELEGSVQQAHIHFGQKGVNGGITVFLCTNLGNGPAGIQPCPASPATISGVLTSADISPNIPATAGASRAEKHGIPVAIVNLTESRGDPHAAVIVQARAGEVLPRLLDAL